MYRVFIVVILFVVSCKNQEKSIKLTDYASMTILEKSNSNIKPQNGDICLIQYATEYNDSTYDYSSDVNSAGVTMVFNGDEGKNNGRNPFLLALKEMNEGDSAKITMNLPKEFVELSLKKNMPIRDYVVSNIRFKKLLNQMQADSFNSSFSANSMIEYQQFLKKDTQVFELVTKYIPALTVGDITQFNTTSSGLKYKIINNGNDIKPTTKDGVRFHISAVSLGGKKLISSFKKAGPEIININSGRLLPSIRDGLKMIGEGGSIIVYQPTSNAVTDKEKEIIYYIEIVNVRKH